MNDLEKERDRARTAVEAASKRLDEAGGAVVHAEIKYDTEPSDEAFAALEVALSSQRRAQLDLTRAERRLEEAEEAFRQAILGERRIELEEVKCSLMPDARREAYEPLLRQIIPLVSKLDGLIEELGGINVQVLERHDRGLYLARLVDDPSFATRHPRPSATEGVSLLRLLLASNSSGVCAEHIVPWTRPQWNGEGIDLYERAQQLLAPEERFE